uniref:AAA+ ATPase domain-containing protein n=1 Tax=Compsopogon caeruleus TaxID=31354 RepID=A0A7S1TF75_9RHOD|mmetsp:Transcript_4563/g.9113  ORF Transcript_4563/g.9113 Transcript_4563/m.9113 type:complete len:318 (+) Transcript_4563:34-987(+)
MELPWVEKYRPTKLDDVVGNEAIIDRLKTIAKHGNMPNLMLGGPPGCGKTTAVGCLAREMLGDKFQEAVLELNASDDRGIDVVRNKIKMFAQRKVTLPPGACKLVILDEADSMTEGAQQALRRTMEIYSATTRFALACNLSSKIIEPIQSRCAVVRFRKLAVEEVTRRLLEVLIAEGAAYDEHGLEAIVFTAEGDMRQALNNAQSTVNGFGMISRDNVFKVCDVPHPNIIADFLRDCQNDDLDKSIERLQILWAEGYAAIDIVQTIFRVLKAHNMPEPLKLEYMRYVGFSHMRIAQGVSSFLQLTSLAAQLCGAQAT